MPIILTPTATAEGLTYLDLCQELAMLASIPGGGPTTVLNQTGELGRVVSWIKRAYNDIQIKHPTWNFLKTDLSFATVAAQQVYTKTSMGALDLNRLDVDSLRIYETSTGIADEQYLVEWDYNSFRDTYLYSTQTAGRPTVFGVREDKAVVLGPPPTATAYTIVGRYWMVPHAMSADGDEPLIPAEYRMAIVYRALLKYAGYEASADAKQTALEEYGPLIRALERDQLSQIQFGEAMA